MTIRTKRKNPEIKNPNKEVITKLAGKQIIVFNKNKQIVIKGTLKVRTLGDERFEDGAVYQIETSSVDLMFKASNVETAYIKNSGESILNLNF